LKPSGVMRFQGTGVVLLNWRDEARTAECVGRLLTLFQPEQIVAVDNESIGKLCTHLEGTGVTVVNLEENRGFAGGVNAGIELCLERGFDYVLAINADTQPSLDGLHPLFEDQEWGPTVAAVGPVVHDTGGTVQSAGSRVRPLTMGIREHRVSLSSNRVDFLTWACVLVKASTFEKIGLLDERFFMYWEDVEFGLRIRRAGLSCRVVPTATVVHAGSVSHHQVGGARIDRYQALGTVVIARVLRRTWLLGAVVRLTARVLRRLVAGRLEAAGEVARGARLGLRVRGAAWAMAEVTR